MVPTWYKCMWTRICLGQWNGDSKIYEFWLVHWSRKIKYVASGRACYKEVKIYEVPSKLYLRHSTYPQMNIIANILTKPIFGTRLVWYIRTLVVEEGVLMCLHIKYHIKFPQVSHDTWLRKLGDMIPCGENPHEQRHGQSIKEYWILKNSYSLDC